jgi:hypothetical protein
LRDKSASFSTSAGNGNGVDVGCGQNEDKMTNLPLKNIAHGQHMTKISRFLCSAGGWD